MKTMPTSNSTPEEVVRSCFKSYVDKDRQAIEALISEDLHFTSPLDNRIDRIRSRLNTLKEDK